MVPLMLPCGGLSPPRIAVALDSANSAPAWIASVVRNLQPVAIVVPPRVKPEPAPSFLYRLYQRWDAVRQVSAPDPLASEPLPDLPVLDLDELREDIDILLWFSKEPPPAKLTGVKEIWVLEDSSSFPEMMRHEPVTTVGLQSVQSHTATEIGWSLAQNRKTALWKAAQLPAKALQLGPSQRQQFPGRAEGVLPSQPYLPTNADMIRFAARNIARTVDRRLRYSNKESHWFVAYRTNPSGFVSQQCRFNSQDWQTLPAPPGHFYADPFVLTWRGRTFLYVEDYLYEEARGVLSVLEWTSEGTFGPATEILNRPYHLSYPFVFEHEGEVYMIPETMEARRIELYRAVEMPGRWELVKVLQENVAAVDTTLWIENSVFYFFTNIAQPGMTANDLLYLFTAESLTGEWRPHPQNPISLDVRAARGAGKLFGMGGKLIRPSQDCSVRYGYAMQMSEVEVLSPQEYRERALFRIEPDWMPGLIGTHTINSNDAVEVIDGQVYQTKYRRIRKES